LTENRPPDAPEFLREAQAGSRNIVLEYLAFVRHSKKWWLAPIVFFLFLLGLLLILGSSGVAPFIYTIF